MQCPLEYNPNGITLASCCVCLLTNVHAGNNLEEMMKLKQAEEKNKSTKPAMIPFRSLLVI